MPLEAPHAPAASLRARWCRYSALTARAVLLAASLAYWPLESRPAAAGPGTLDLLVRAPALGGWDGPVTPAGTCDGRTDSADALNAAAAALAARGGGTLVVDGRCLIDGADLVVPNSVRIMGAWYPGGQRRPAEYADLATGTLVIDPRRTVRMGTGSQLSNLVLARKGLTRPDSMRSGIAALAAFAGTAVTIAGSQDASLQDLLILGFDRAIDAKDSQRVRVASVYGDNNNGLRIDHSHDISRISDTHWWGFLTGNAAWTFTRLEVTGAASNGAGLVRLTTGTAHGLASGDQVNLSVPGVLAPVHAAVSVVDGTHIDVRGSAFSGRYAGGGFVLMDLTRRPGRAFEVTHSEGTTIRDSFAFGYAGGVLLGDGAGWTQLIGTSMDSYILAADPGTRGITIEGTAYGTSVVGGVLSSAANEIVVDSTGQEGHSFTGMSINPGNGIMIQVLRGRAVFTGNHGPEGAATISVSDAGYLDLVGNMLPGATVIYQSALARSHTVLAGNMLAGGQPQSQGGPVSAGSYGVGSLPMPCTAGQTAYATDGRNNGQPEGAGTGLLVTCDGIGVWRAPWSGLPVRR